MSWKQTYKKKLVTPDAGALQRLQFIVGHGLTRELAFTAKN